MKEKIARAEATWHAPAYTGMLLRSRAHQAVLEAAEASSSSVTSAEEEPRSTSGNNPQVAGEKDDSDEEEQGELNESDTPPLISDSDYEYDENDISYDDYADETQEQPPSFPIHPTPKLNKARNIAIHQYFKEGEHSRPTARLESKRGAAVYT